MKKQEKKFVLVGFVLLAITGLLALSGCKTEVDTSTPQQEQTADSGGNNDSTGTGENAGTGGNGSTGGNAGTGDNTSGGGDSGMGGEGGGDNPSAGNDGDSEEKPGAGESNTELQPCSHQPEADDGDCTTEVQCTVCGEVAVAAKSHDFTGEWQKDAENHWHDCKNEGCNKTDTKAAHFGGTATCVKGRLCGTCGLEYSVVDATSMSAEELNTAVTNVLSAGERYIEITMTATPEDELFTAIRRAICDTEGVEDGSINLLLKGVTVIPDHHEFEGQGSSIFGQVQKTDGTVENVTQLSSVNLPDVLTIGTVAFLYCKNLTAVTAPKVQTIGRYTFYGTVLTSVNFPEAKTIDNSAFSYCRDIKEFNLPKVTVLGENALDIAVPDGEVTMYLTSADEIVVHKYCFHALEILENLDTKVNLVLNGNKRSQVNENTWTTKDADGNDVSFTFKSITFVGE